MEVETFKPRRPDVADADTRALTSSDRSSGFTRTIADDDAGEARC